MKRIFTLLLAVLLSFTAVSCNTLEAPQKPTTTNTNTNTNTKTERVEYEYKDTFITNEDPNNPSVMGLFYRNTIGADISSKTDIEKESDRMANEMLQKVIDTPDTVKAAEGCKTYYLSADGKDTNDGLSPETARKNYYTVKPFLREGDAVLLRRGDIFREYFEIPKGVSVGAYGEGELKPRIYGSVDGRSYKWEETDVKDVYRFCGNVLAYANIVFNNGQSVCNPVTDFSKIKKQDLSCYFDNGIYLYCRGGNPADVFYSIEIVSAINTGLVSLKGGDTKLQNLCIMNTGRHAIRGGGSVNVYIEGCVIGFCGGEFLPQGKTSIGNGVEFWNSAENVYINNNYLFQCYDAALTHQGPSRQKKPTETGVTYKNIHYEDNLIEYCTYDFEAFIVAEEDIALSPNANWKYDDVYIRNNICRFNGYGWGSLVRPGGPFYANIKYTACGSCFHAKPLYVENNIFDRSRNHVLGVGIDRHYDTNYVLRNNKFIQYKTAYIYSETPFSNPLYESVIKRYFGVYEGNEFYTLKK